MSQALGSFLACRCQSVLTRDLLQVSGILSLCSCLFYDTLSVNLSCLGVSTLFTPSPQLRQPAGLHLLSLPCILETLSGRKLGQSLDSVICFPFFRPQCPSLPDIPCLESHSLIGGCFRQEGNSGPSFILSTSRSQNSCFKCVPVSSTACRKVHNVFEKFVAILIDILGPRSHVMGLQAVTEGVFVKTSVKHGEQKQGLFRIR